MSSYLPKHEGLLPLWLLMVGLTSIGNAIQAFLTLSYTRRLYAGQSPSSTSSTTKLIKTTTTVLETTAPPAASRPTIQDSATAESHVSPVTPLSARTFGTWTFLAGIVRIYAAYHIDEKPWYQLAVWSYVVALFHFTTEAFVFKSARPQGPWLAPVSVAILSLVWLIAQYGSYSR